MEKKKCLFFLCLSKAKVASLACFPLLLRSHMICVYLCVHDICKKWLAKIWIFISISNNSNAQRQSKATKNSVSLWCSVRRKTIYLNLFFSSNEYAEHAEAPSVAVFFFFFVCICVQPHDDNPEFVYIKTFLLNRETRKKRANLRTGKWLLSLLFVAHLLLPPNVYCRYRRLEAFRLCAWLATNARLFI